MYIARGSDRCLTLAFRGLAAAHIAAEAALCKLASAEGAQHTLRYCRPLGLTIVDHCLLPNTLLSRLAALQCIPTPPAFAVRHARHVRFFSRPCSHLVGSYLFCARRATQHSAADPSTSAAPGCPPGAGASATTRSSGHRPAGKS